MSASDEQLQSVLSPILFIILPAYNEEPALRQLIPDISQALRSLNLPFKICLIDDASRDGTETLAQTFSKEFDLEYTRHSANQGYGAALRSGFLWVIRNAQPQDIAITMDADNTHSPSDIPKLIRKIDEGFDVVTASYKAPGGQAVGVSWIRRLMSNGANLLLNLRFRLAGVRSYTNGFRAYRVTALQHAFERYQEHLIEATGFPGGTELFLKVCSLGAKPSEVPFVLHYERRGKDSKINLPRTVLGYLNLLWLTRSVP